MCECEWVFELMCRECSFRPKTKTKTFYEYRQKTVWSVENLNEPHGRHKLTKLFQKIAMWQYNYLQMQNVNVLVILFSL